MIACKLISVWSVRTFSVIESVFAIQRCSSRGLSIKWIIYYWFCANRRQCVLYMCILLRRQIINENIYIYISHTMVSSSQINCVVLKKAIYPDHVWVHWRYDVSGNLISNKKEKKNVNGFSRKMCTWQCVCVQPRAAAVK